MPSRIIPIMSAVPTHRTLRPNAGNVATFTVVLVAFIVTWVAYFADRADGNTEFSVTALAVATLLGTVYLVLLMRGYDLLRHLAGRHTIAATMILLVSLMLIIEFLLVGSNGIWLISMPLVATATTDLPRGPRALVYAAAIIGVVLPGYLRFGNWEFSFFTTLTFITAFVFVIAFVRLNQAAEAAQQQAEQLAGQLADANRRLGDYAIQAEELATIQERNRLAREIHDNLGHYLTVINVQISAARALMNNNEHARADAALEKAGRLTQEGLTAIRQSISSLRESALGRRSLPNAIADLAAETQAAGVVAELHTDGPIRRLDARAELTLYRAAQEGLTNVRKHARASRVDLTLDYNSPDSVTLTIQDNGIGPTQTEIASGFGLLGLQERARQLGGHVSVQTAPGQGYSLIVHLPEVGSESVGLNEEAI